MISEKTIDQIIGQFEADEIDYEATAKEFAERQPAILSFLMAEQEGALTIDERDFMIYMATVIWQAVEHAGPVSTKVTAPEVATREEANWAKLEHAKGRTLRERLTIFFENTPQEDLLAFIEDSLTLDEVYDGAEGLQITAEGAEPMFVMLKTVVDVLTAN
ncbi:MAG: hypothetical protein AAFZ15_10265 [Bacteroidota bacterium]